MYRQSCTEATGTPTLKVLRLTVCALRASGGVPAKLHRGDRHPYPKLFKFFPLTVCALRASGDVPAKLSGVTYPPLGFAIAITFKLQNNCLSRRLLYFMLRLCALQFG